MNHKNGKFASGNRTAVGHGRPVGKTPETILNELRPIAIEKLELAVRSGDPTACAAVIGLTMRDAS